MIPYPTSVWCGSTGVAAPTTDPYFSNVVLLIGGNGVDASTSFVDESPLAQAVTVFGAAQVDTPISKFGTGSLMCTTPGSDYIQVPDHAGFAFGSGDFTIEFFWQSNSTSNSDNHYILGQGSAGGYAWNGVAVESNCMRFYQRDSGAEVYETSYSFTPVLNQWYHMVAERAGTIMRLYRNGTMVAKVTLGTVALTDATDPFRVGQIWPGTGTNSHLDEVRVTKGVARYNSDSGYTVPTAAFPRA